jgi:hypothetical protein
MSTTEPVSDETAKSVLSLPLPPGNDAGASDVRGYLIALLEELWREEEGFSGKRPFGNSGWQYDLYAPLAAAGMVEATFDEDNYLDQFPTASMIRADELILAAIKALGEPTS